MSVALAFVSATLVPQHEFRMMDASGDLECPVVGTHFRVWKLQPRHVQQEERHDWRVGVRLGPIASGPSTDYARSETRAPPALRKTTNYGDWVGSDSQ